jgi:hypothetical protein
MSLGISVSYQPRAEVGGMDLSDTNRRKLLEDENTKLKRLVSNVMLNRGALWFAPSRENCSAGSFRNHQAWHYGRATDPKNKGEGCCGP